MLKAAEIRDALADLIKERAKLDVLVFFNHVNNSAKSYCWVRLRPRQVNEGFGYFRRMIAVDIQVVLAPDENGEIKHTELYRCLDALTEAITAPLRVKNRFITILDSNSIIFDDILTFSFSLDFADAVSMPPEELLDAELMRLLNLELTTEGKSAIL